jgi:hypothetical protein
VAGGLVSAGENASSNGVSAEGGSLVTVMEMVGSARTVSVESRLSDDSVSTPMESGAVEREVTIVGLSAGAAPGEAIADWTSS